MNGLAILPSNQTPLGALPARFRRERLLIVGCGDVGMRVAAQLRGKVSLLALTSQSGRRDVLRAHGLTPLLGDLDNSQSLRRLAGLATRIVHLAPPPSESWFDPRTQNLVRVLRLRNLPRSGVYGSTSGVYGDCDGAWVTETQALRARTPRAQRRTCAEAHMRFLGLSAGMRTSILRIPGIYAQDRDGGTPRARLLKGTPVLQQDDDVYTNHIHADDLARACSLALWKAAPQRIYNVNDDSDLKMGDYFDLAADLYGLPRPPRIAREGAAEQLPLVLLSFMNESRRMVNTRMKRELGIQLRYPSVRTGLAQ